MTPSRVLLAALAAGLMVAAPLAGAPPAPAAWTALGVTEVRAPSPMPDLTLRTVGGAPLALGSLRGRPVLVNFFATWCKPCEWEMPLLEKLYRAHKARGFVMLGIALDQGNLERVADFVADLGLTFPIALDPTHDAARRFGLRGLPGTFLIGRDGYVKGVVYGPKEWNGGHAHALVESLLAPAAGASR